MSNKKIYTKRPLQYQQWKEIGREVLELVVCIAGLLLLNYALETLARWIV